MTSTQLHQNDGPMTITEEKRAYYSMQGTMA